MRDSSHLHFTFLRAAVLFAFFGLTRVHLHLSILSESHRVINLLPFFMCSLCLNLFCTCCCFQFSVPFTCLRCILNFYLFSYLLFDPVTFQQLTIRFVRLFLSTEQPHTSELNLPSFSPLLSCSGLSLSLSHSLLSFPFPFGRLDVSSTRVPSYRSNDFIRQITSHRETVRQDQPKKTNQSVRIREYCFNQKSTPFHTRKMYLCPFSHKHIESFNDVHLHCLMLRPFPPPPSQENGAMPELVRANMRVLVMSQTIPMSLVRQKGTFFAIRQSKEAPEH